MSNNHYAFSGNPNAQSYSDPYSHQGYSNHPSGPYQDHDGNQGPTSAFSPHNDQDVSEMDNVTRQRTRPQSDAFDEKSVHQHNNYGSGPGMAAGGTYGGSSQRNSIWSADDKHVFFRRSVPARIFRSIFCIVIWTIIIIVSVILLVVTFAKPPNVAVMSIAVPDGNDFSVSGTSFKANGSVNFAVSNPNSFSATIEHLQAHLYDANLGKSVSVGNGTLQSQKIKANDNTTIVFPFDIGIDLASDATELISDVASQCGLTDLVNSLKGRDEAGLTSDDVAVLQARASNQLTVLLDIDARVSILSVGISVPVSKNITIDCPTAALQSVLGSLTGGSSGKGASGALSGILGGGRKRREIEHDAL